MFGACATIPVQQRALFAGRDGEVIARVQPCGGSEGAPDAAAELFDGESLRVISWNLHKNRDAGWNTDLARFASNTDLVLIQEAALTPELRGVVETAGLSWFLAGAFRWGGTDLGVMTAARVKPSSACTQETTEPLLRLPKAAAITYYPVHGATTTLAVANVHAINFTLGLDAYRGQLEAVAAELAHHKGPTILAGDLNTWSADRVAVVEAIARELALASAVPIRDQRSRFNGHQVDYVYVRGLDVVDAEAPPVRSSDHNPLMVTLRIR
jgi:endonuclease/exonuclease/phosphatase (EEP) superfamily protein YafD